MAGHVKYLKMWLILPKSHLHLSAIFSPSLWLLILVFPGQIPVPCPSKDWPIHPMPGLPQIKQYKTHIPSFQNAPARHRCAHPHSARDFLFSQGLQNGRHHFINIPYRVYQFIIRHMFFAKFHLRSKSGIGFAQHCMAIARHHFSFLQRFLYIFRNLFF